MKTIRAMATIVMGILPGVIAQAQQAAPQPRPAGQQAFPVINRPGTPAPAAAAPLTAEQQAAVQKAMADLRTESQTLYQKLGAARQAVEAAVNADKFDESAIRAKAAEIGKIEGDLAVLRGKNFDNLSKILSKEQLAQYKARGGPLMDRRPAGRSPFPVQGEIPPPSPRPEPPQAK